MQLGKTHWRSVRAAARHHAIEITPPHPGSGQALYEIAGRNATVKVAYHGGASILQHIAGNADIALVRAGKDGNWFVVVPARDFFGLLATSREPARNRRANGQLEPCPTQLALPFPEPGNEGEPH